MGYTTTFGGELLFNRPLNEHELAHLKKVLGEDGRVNPEWGIGHLTYIDYELNDNQTGIEWDGCEKSYDMTEKAQFIVNHMNRIAPGFYLEGDLRATGECPDDHWILRCDKDGCRMVEQHLVESDPSTADLVKSLADHTQVTPEAIIDNLVGLCWDEEEAGNLKRNLKS